jgi:hypothetical protein
VSPWILAEDIPQVLATDATGQFALREVDLGAQLSPRGEVNVGDLPLGPPAALEVTIGIPEGEPAAAISLEIEAASIATVTTGEVARLLAVLDRIDPQLGDFATRRGPYSITREGTTRLAPLPAWDQAVIIARGVTPDKSARRTVQFTPGQTARISFEADELYPATGPVTRFEGVVRLAGSGIPVVGAGVTVEWVRGRAATESGADGSYTLEDVPTTQILNFTLDANDKVNDPPRFNHREVKRLPALERNDAVTSLDWEVPAIRWLTVTGAAEEIPAESLSPKASLEALDAGGNWAPVPGKMEYHFETGRLMVEILEPGTYRAIVRRTTFEAQWSEPATFGADEYAAAARLEPADPSARQLTLLVRKPSGEPAPQVTAVLTPAFPHAEGAEVRGNPMGMVNFGPVNLAEVHVRITSPDGCFDGVVTLERTANTVVELLPCP